MIFRDKNYLAICLKLSFASFIFLLGLLIVLWPRGFVLAESCQCVHITATKAIISIHEAEPVYTYKETLDSCENNINSLICQDREKNKNKTSTKYDYYTCKSYVDDQCKTLSSSVVAVENDVNNRCWEVEKCKAAGGVPDSEQSPECVALKLSGLRRCFVKSPAIPLQIGIPGVTKRFCSVFTLGKDPKECTTDQDCAASNLGSCRPGIEGGFTGYIVNFYKFFISMLAVVAVVMVTWGAFKRIMAAGSAEKIKASNDTIFGAVIGLFIALISFSLLNLINPQLVGGLQLKMDKVKTELFNSNFCSREENSSTGEPYLCGKQVVVNGQKCVGSVCPGSVGGGCYKVSDTGKIDKNSGLSVDYKCIQGGWAECATINDDNVLDRFPLTQPEDGSIYNKACTQFNDTNGQCLWAEYSSTAGGLALLAIPVAAFAAPYVVGAGAAAAGTGAIVSAGAASTTAAGTAFTLYGATGAVVSSGVVGAAGGALATGTAAVSTSAAVAGGAAAGTMSVGVAGILARDDQCMYLSNDFITAFCNGTEFGGKIINKKPANCEDFNTPVTDEVTGLDWPFCYNDLCKLGCGAKWGTVRQTWHCEHK